MKACWKWEWHATNANCVQRLGDAPQLPVQAQAASGGCKIFITKMPFFSAGFSVAMDVGAVRAEAAKDTHWGRPGRVCSVHPCARLTVKRKDPATRYRIGLKDAEACRKPEDEPDDWWEWWYLLLLIPVFICCWVCVSFAWKKRERAKEENEEKGKPKSDPTPKNTLKCKIVGRPTNTQRGPVICRFLGGLWVGKWVHFSWTIGRPTILHFRVTQRIAAGSWS